MKYVFRGGMPLQSGKLDRCCKWDEGGMLWGGSCTFKRMVRGVSTRKVKATVWRDRVSVSQSFSHSLMSAMVTGLVKLSRQTILTDKSDVPLSSKVCGAAI